jgi:uncharacterized membrane protein YfcA
MQIEEVAAVAGILFAGSVVQGAVGFAFIMVAVPLLVSQGMSVEIAITRRCFGIAKKLKEKL